MDSKAEIELGNVAQHNASGDAVKQFAQRMVQDHGKVSQDLERLASSKNIALTQTVNEEQRKNSARLSKLSGAKFDREYMQAMVEDHQKAVDQFQREANNAQDPDLKSFVSNTLPTLQEHLRQAQEVSNSLPRR